MKKRLIQLAVIVSVLLFMCSCGKSEGFNIFGTTGEFIYQSPSSTAPYTHNTQPEETSYYTEAQPTSEAAVVDTPTTQTTAPVTQQSPAFEATETPETTEKVYEKTGEMAFSDSADNKYIKAIVSKYGVDAKNLAVLYTVPDNDGNIVLEFNGTTDSSGKLIRNKDTLITIYSIDKDLNSKRASENPSLNEYSYGEMKVMFISTTKHIMPEFEAELNG